MATIEKRQDAKGITTYRVKVRIKGFPAQSATFDRLSKAKEWAKSTEAAIKEGRHFKTVEAKRHTLADLIDRYIRSVLPQKSASSKTHQEQQLAWWKEQLGSYLLADITPALIAEYRDKLQETPYRKTDSPDAQTLERSPATVVRYLAALSHAFTVAMKEWGWIEENPVVKVTKPKESRGRVRFLSDDERGRLLDACRESRSPDLYLAVVLALSTGARQQEILGLKWKDVDLERKVAVLHETKNGERRVLPLAGVALEMLKERKRCTMKRLSDASQRSVEGDGDLFGRHEEMDGVLSTVEKTGVPQWNTDAPQRRVEGDDFPARYGEMGASLLAEDDFLPQRKEIEKDTRPTARRVPESDFSIQRREMDGDLIFPSRAASVRRTHSRKDKTTPVDLRTPFETALKKAQIEDFRWHDLRHSAASYLAMNGASLAEIAEILGHKTLAMVKRYAHLSEQHTASVVERMNERIFG